MQLLALILCTTTLWISSEGYKSLQDSIPNGAHVPNPCRPKHLWNGVGHKHWEGGGATNIFGDHLRQNSFKWNKCLCELDSDGDGRTNGEELGDPSCTWTPGQLPERTTELTHPGICDPYDDSKCADVNDFDVCADVEFQCDAIKESDVKTLELRIPLTNVPRETDISMCMTFDLPAEDNHVIAWEPIIDNPYILHHIQVFGCKDEDYEVTQPTPCSTAGMRCQRLLLVYTLGRLGNCYPDNYGVRIGPKGIKRFVFQVGWENTLGLSGHSDSSGIKFYYTPALRLYDLGMMMMGQYRLNIPPGRKEYIEKGVCGPKCTNKLTGPMYVVEAYLQMRYHGIWAQVSIFRDGKEIATPVQHAEYRYHQPEHFKFGDPIEVRPGDEIVTTCAYNSQRRKSIMHWSWSSLEEACVAWFTFFPDETGMGRSCLSHGTEYQGCSEYPFPSTGNCDINEYVASDFDNDLALLRSSCERFRCKYSCTTAVANVRRNECFDDAILPDVLFNIRGSTGEGGREFSDYLHSCLDNIYGPPDDVVEKPEASNNSTECFWEKSPGRASQLQASHLAFMGVIVACLFGRTSS